MGIWTVYLKHAWDSSLLNNLSLFLEYRANYNTHIELWFYKRYAWHVFCPARFLTSRTIFSRALGQRSVDTRLIKPDGRAICGQGHALGGHSGSASTTATPLTYWQIWTYARFHGRKEARTWDLVPADVTPQFVRLPCSCTHTRVTHAHGSIRRPLAARGRRTENGGGESSYLLSTHFRPPIIGASERISPWASLLLSATRSSRVAACSDGRYRSLLSPNVYFSSNILIVA